MQHVLFDREILNICKKIRGIAKLDRVRIDYSEHRNGLNKHLFDYLEYCGYGVLDYVKRYLSLLQPFMVEIRKDQVYDKHITCIIDKLYRISVYIKVNTKQFEEVIVSFHEDNKNGIAKVNSVYRKAPEYVPIICDGIESQVENSNSYGVKVVLMRGLLTLPIHLSAKRIDKVFLVKYSEIERSFVDYCNEYIRDLYTSDLNLDFNSIQIFTMLQQIEFTSSGKDSFSSVSLLLDSLHLQRDKVSQNVADFALITYVSNLKLMGEDRDEFLSLLKTKYSVSADRNIHQLLLRVEDSLPIIQEDEESLTIDEEAIWKCIPEATRSSYGNTKREQLQNYLESH